MYPFASHQRTAPQTDMVDTTQLVNKVGRSRSNSSLIALGW